MSRRGRHLELAKIDEKRLGMSTYSLFEFKEAQAPSNEVYNDIKLFL